MEKLTKAQAIVISAYTGFLICNFSDLQEEVGIGDIEMKSASNNSFNLPLSASITIPRSLIAGSPIRLPIGDMKMPIGRVLITKGA